MGWIIRSLINVVIEYVTNFIKWMLAVFTGLKIDIGYDTSTGKNTLFLISYFNGEGKGLFDSTFPDAHRFFGVFLLVAYGFAIAIVIYQLYKSMMTPNLRDSESPIGLAGRGLLTFFLISISYDLFILFEKMANSFLKEFKAVFTDVRSDFTKNVPDNVFNCIDSLSKMDKVFKGSGTVSFGNEKAYTIDVGFGNDDNIGLMLLVAIFFTALAIQFFKLIIEIYERYVVLGVLFYTCPIAFSTLASERTKDVFSKWLQMVLAQFLLMMLNMFFVAVFIGAFGNLLTSLAEHNYLFTSPTDMMKKMFILIAWLVTGTKVDEHLRSLGLSAVRTGQGLYGAIMTATGLDALALGTPGKVINGTRRTASNVAAARDTVSKVKSKVSSSESQVRDAESVMSKAERIDGKLTKDGASSIFKSDNENVKMKGHDAKDAFGEMGIGPDNAQFKEQFGYKMKTTNVDADGNVSTGYRVANTMDEVDWNNSEFGHGLATIKDSDGKVRIQFGDASKYTTPPGVAMKSTKMNDGTVVNYAATTDIIKHDHNSMMNHLNASKLDFGGSGKDKIQWQSGMPIYDEKGNIKLGSDGKPLMKDIDSGVATGFKDGKAAFQAAPRYIADCDPSIGQIVDDKVNDTPICIQRVESKPGFANINRAAESAELIPQPEYGKTVFRGGEAGENSKYTKYGTVDNNKKSNPFMSKRMENSGFEKYKTEGSRKTNPFKAKKK